jgi:multiple sugar transport system ATP-binding protein
VANVTLENLRKVYPGGVVAMEDLSMRIADGEFVVLLGPSGCGKTTTLQMIAGLEQETAGRVLIGDQDVTRLSADKRDIAMVFQSYALYPNKKVYDNMAFGLQMRKTPRAEIDRRVRQAAQKLGLTEILSRKPSQLSGGQRQRVALGRAIVREPRVFLLDEPLSNVDAKLRGEMRRELKALHRDLGVTFIYVTHDQVEAMSMGDRVAVFNHGVLQQFDTPMGVYNRPANVFVAGFVGAPQMNMCHGVIDETAATFVAAGLRYTWRRHTWPAHLEGRRVVLGYRPTDVKVTKASDEPHHIRGRVELHEPLGSDMLLSLRADDQLIVVRADPDFEVDDGALVDVVIPEHRAHLFDEQSGQRLTATARSEVAA